MKLRDHWQWRSSDGEYQVSGAEESLIHGESPQAILVLEVGHGNNPVLTLTVPLSNVSPLSTLEVKVSNNMGTREVVPKTISLEIDEHGVPTPVPARETNDFPIPIPNDVFNEAVRRIVEALHEGRE